MYNVTVTFLKGSTIHMKNYAEVADDEVLAMNKAIVACKKEHNCALDEIIITNIEEVS